MLLSVGSTYQQTLEIGCVKNYDHVAAHLDGTIATIQLSNLAMSLCIYSRDVLKV